MDGWRIRFVQLLYTVCRTTCVVLWWLLLESDDNTVVLYTFDLRPIAMCLLVNHWAKCGCKSVTSDKRIFVGPNFMVPTDFVAQGVFAQFLIAQIFQCD